jgi:DNA-binding winged helix-turn-helix (wHTH) protein/tetratricopeptide (TPR) repeat protein
MVTKGFFEFGPYRLDADTRLLTRNGELVHLTPKAAETLLVLVRRHGQLVEKEALLEAVWPDTAVEENNLSQHLSALRRVLADGGGDRAYIETIPKRGFRFVVEVVEGSNGEPMSPNAAPKASSRHGPLWTAALVIMLAAVAATVTWAVRAVRRVPNPDVVSPRPARAGTTNVQAQDLYLRGMFLAGRGNEADNLAAIRLLEEAVGFDASFAAGHAQLARAYCIRFSTYAPEDQKLYEPKAHAAVQRALALAPDLPDAYLARGMLLWSPARFFRHEDSIRDYQHALALDPKFGLAHRQIAQVYNHVGLFQQSLREAAKATELNPELAPPRLSIGLALTWQGRYEEAVKAWLGARDMLPALSGGHLAWALFQLGRRQEARERIADALKRDTADSAGVLTSVSALIDAAEGDRSRAEAGLRTALQAKRTELFHHTAYFAGSAYCRMGDAQKALDWLRFAAENGFPCYPLYASDPNLDFVRNDRRFQDLLEDLSKDWVRYRALASGP